MQSMLERIREMRKNGTFPISPNPSSGHFPLPMTIESALAMFGYSVFREGQEEAINEVVNGQNGVLVVWPTGHGKSLVYQIPALMLDGITIVVSPLISLMKDQVDKLQKIGIKTMLINSSLTNKQAREAITEVVGGMAKVLYIAPERFENDEFNRSMYGMNVGLLAIDEAHCISRWGHDFRPSYSKIGRAISNMKPKKIVALTATATRKVQDDICSSLGIPDAKRFVRGVHRPNLELAVLSGLGYSRIESMRRLVEDFQRSGYKTGLIYVPTKKEAESICEYFMERNVDCAFYHAGMKPKERTIVQNRWAENGGVIIATTAFGMGIDRPDVRFVFHSGLSASIEDWYQEIGRAGRDGDISLCASFWDYDRDYDTQMMFINMTNPDGQTVEEFWTWLRSVALKQSKPGASTVTVNMTQKDMGMISGCDSVGGVMSFLRKNDLVRTLDRGKYRVSLVGGQNLDYSELDRRRQANIDKLDKVVSFYETKDCRAAFVCDYFGDTSFSGGCGTCDNCKP